VINVDVAEASTTLVITPSRAPFVIVVVVMPRFKAVVFLAYVALLRALAGHVKEIDAGRAVEGTAGCGEECWCRM